MYVQCTVYVWYLVSYQEHILYFLQNWSLRLGGFFLLVLSFFRRTISQLTTRPSISLISLSFSVMSWTSISFSWFYGLASCSPTMYLYLLSVTWRVSLNVKSESQCVSGRLYIHRIHKKLHEMKRRGRRSKKKNLEIDSQSEVEIFLIFNPSHTHCLVFVVLSPFSFPIPPICQHGLTFFFFLQLSILGEVVTGDTSGGY